MAPGNELRLDTDTMNSSYRFLLLTLAFVSTAAEVHPKQEVHPFHPYHPKLEQKARQSQAPQRTNSTTAPVPTDSPTESPAPSPSPSSNPTTAPTGTQPPTKKPTSAPTESPAPSPSPSSVPTNLPSLTPSESPTDAPTRTKMPSGSPSLSQAPSSAPSGTPTGFPSIAPTPAPTGTPSSAPSGTPTITPSVGPTNVPTQSPSSTPSASPTEEAFKTKFSNIGVVLMDIDREMSDTHLAQFEITTLEFIRDTAPHTEGYEIDVLAVTLLSQTAVYPDGENQTANHQGERRMETKSGLEVKFKSVGVVTEGSVPTDFNFKNDIVNPGFENHMDEYLYRLSMSDAFFEPLKAHTSYHVEVEPESKGKFIAAVVFSVIAFLVAVFAAVYAIRRHLNAKRRRQNRRARLSGGQKSQTYSENSAESTDDSDEENGDKPPLQLAIFSPTKTDMQNVPITPRSIASPFKQDYRDNEASPLSPGTAKNAEPTSMLEGTGAAIRKWLSSPKENAEQAEANRPPRPNSSPDPMALKASTTDKPGTLSKGNTNHGVSLEIFINLSGDIEEAFLTISSFSRSKSSISLK